MHSGEETCEAREEEKMTPRAECGDHTDRKVEKTEEKKRKEKKK
jgi:hypothetical protein